MTVTEDCPIEGGKLPLVVISHGRGGDFLGHHDTAEALADAGFVAVAINHPGDTASDKSRIDDPSVFVERPTDIKRTIDFMLGAWSNSARIDPSSHRVLRFLPRRVYRPRRDRRRIELRQGAEALRRQRQPDL